MPLDWNSTIRVIAIRYLEQLIKLDDALLKWCTTIRYTSLTARGDDYSTPC